MAMLEVPRLGREAALKPSGQGIGQLDHPVWLANRAVGECHGPAYLGVGIGGKLSREQPPQPEHPTEFYALPGLAGADPLRLLAIREAAGDFAGAVGYMVKPPHHGYRLYQDMYTTIPISTCPVGRASMPSR